MMFRSIDGTPDDNQTELLFFCALSKANQQQIILLIRLVIKKKKKIPQKIKQNKQNQRNKKLNKNLHTQKAQTNKKPHCHRSEEKKYQRWNETKLTDGQWNTCDYSWIIQNICCRINESKFQIHCVAQATSSLWLNNWNLHTYDCVKNVKWYHHTFYFSLGFFPIASQYKNVKRKNYHATKAFSDTE